ncbi:putative glutamine amidotransferase [Trypanosoma rangeli]|uniref:GMP synthase (glutamine-hydrolyzing) n=1 Tax=Trypanosoma rangeli TaxID=5698 RepID=A0A3R7K201_TRYRA|nr:putative glutamine amidotransferase [Trypanosoma rangeli]RNF00408.1 putative glutamine amidotransferase [Trypanosoma rangeli]|eukprot:RNF00408.1 putative glutamine amidotransferase [Trypanosoma rangeli]
METHGTEQEYVVILDAGSQYGKVIDRKIRELKVESRVMPLNTPTETLRSDRRIKGIIISGGPSSIYDKDAPAFNPDLFEVGKPLLGVCYGMQLLTQAFGGSVGQTDVREDGQDEIWIDLTSQLFNGLSSKEKVLLTHGDSITEPGPQLKVIARSSANIIAAVGHHQLPLFGVQFHPEVELTENGMQIFKNFLTLCGCHFTFTMEDREQVALRMIRERTAQGQKVLCLASGGVDSTVCAVLLLKALGRERVVCVHIDHGFMRLRESEEVVAALEGAGVSVILVNASEQFAQATTEMPARRTRAPYRTEKLCEVVDPEEKRVIIGNTFMSVCDAVVKDLKLDVNNILLAQGTLRPDLIESGSPYASCTADTIKTHHNDTAVVRQLRESGLIIEPLCDYHKDEVRELGVRLGISPHLVQRQPFPGPGLAIRTLCSDGMPYRDEFYESTAQVVQAICKGDTSIELVQPLSEALKDLQPASCILPVRTVGVQGDGRTYAYAVAISTGRSPSEADWRVLSRLALVIPKVARHVNRVVFMFGPRRDTAPQRVTKTTLTPASLNKLRIADDLVNSTLLKHDLVRRLSQVPVILTPLGFEEKGQYSIVIRTFVTNDFMTGVPALPGTPLMPLAALEEVVNSLQQLDFVSRVLYDLTAKPPGTTEWE